MPALTNSIKSVFSPAARPRLPGDPSPPAVSLTLTPAANNINEGSALTFDVSTGNIRDQDRIFYKIISVTGDIAVLEGSVVVSSNAASFTVTPVADLLTEAPGDTFVVQLYRRTPGGVLMATSGTITINDTSFESGLLLRYDAAYHAATPASNTVTSRGTTAVEATLTNGVTFESSPPSFVFDPADNEYITVDISPEFDDSLRSDIFLGSSHSIEAWINFSTYTPTLTDANENQQGVVLWPGWHQGIAIHPDGIRYNTYRTASEASYYYHQIAAADVAANTWTHICHVVERTLGTNTATWYVNGVLYSTQALGFVGGTVIENTGYIGAGFLNIGAARNSGSFRWFLNNGKIGSVRLYNTALDQQAVTDAFNLYKSTYGVGTPTAVFTIEATINEGSSLTINVSIIGVALPDSTTLYWTIDRAADFSSSSGSFTITSNAGSFTVTPTADFLTEGTETFTVSVRTEGVSGNIIGTSDAISILDTSVETYAVSAAAADIDEGSPLTINVTTQGVPNDTTLYYTVSASGDFGSSSGSFVINSDTGSFTVTPSLDRTTEGSETFTVSVRTGSVSGTVKATSSSITINDISLTPAFTSEPASVNEGFGASFTVNNLGPAGTYYWTINNITTTNARFSEVNGSFTTDTLNGSAEFSVLTVINDVFGDTAAFQVQVRSGSISGPVIITSSNVTVNDVSIQIQLVTGPGGSVVTEVSEQAGRNIRFTTAANTPSYVYDWEVENITTTYDNQFFNSGDFTNGKGSVSLTSNDVDETQFLGVRGGDGIEIVGGVYETFRIIIKYFGIVYGRSEVFSINSDFQ